MKNKNDHICIAKQLYSIPGYEREIFTYYFQPIDNDHFYTDSIFLSDLNFDRILNSEELEIEEEFEFDEEFEKDFICNIDENNLIIEKFQTGGLIHSLLNSRSIYDLLNFLSNNIDKFQKIFELFDFPGLEFNIDELYNSCSLNKDYFKFLENHGIVPISYDPFMFKAINLIHLPGVEFLSSFYKNTDHLYYYAVNIYNKNVFFKQEILDILLEKTTFNKKLYVNNKRVIFTSSKMENSYKQIKTKLILDYFYIIKFNSEFYITNSCCLSECFKILDNSPSNSYSVNSTYEYYHIKCNKHNLKLYKTKISIEDLVSGEELYFFKFKK